MPNLENINSLVTGNPERRRLIRCIIGRSEITNPESAARYRRPPGLRWRRTAVAVVLYQLHPYGKLLVRTIPLLTRRDGVNHTEEFL